MSAHALVISSRGNTRNTQDAEEAVFEMLDADGDGVITMDELAGRPSMRPSTGSFAQSGAQKDLPAVGTKSSLAARSPTANVSLGELALKNRAASGRSTISKYSSDGSETMWRQGTVTTDVMHGGQLHLSRRVLAERLSLEIQFTRACPKFMMLLGTTLLFLGAMDAGRLPDKAHNVGTLLIHSLALGDMDSVKSPAAMIEYLKSFASASQRFHPLSSSYLPDPLQTELVGHAQLFQESVVVPSSLHPVLTSSFTFTTWLLLDDSEVGESWSQRTIVNKFNPSARQHVQYATTPSCWGWAYVSRATSDRWVGFTQLQFGRHLDNYMVIPKDTQDMKTRTMAQHNANQQGRVRRRLAARGRSTSQDEDEELPGGSAQDEDAAAGDFTAADGPIFLAVVVNGTASEAVFYQGATEIWREKMDAQVTDCGSMGDANLEVGDLGVGLAQLRFHPKALTPQEVGEVATLGQPLKEISSSSVRIPGDPSARSELHQDINKIKHKLDDTEGRAQGLSVLSSQISSSALQSSIQPPAASPSHEIGNESAGPADQQSIIVSQPGLETWSQPLDISKEFASAFVKGGMAATVTQWLSSTDTNGYQFSVAPQSTSNYADQCFSLYRRDEGSTPVFRLLLGFALRDSRATRFCKMEPTKFNTGDLNHYAVSIQADTSKNLFKVDLHFDGRHACGFEATYEPEVFNDLVTCLSDTERIGRSWVGKRAPDSGLLDNFKLQELRIYPKRLDPSEVGALSEDPMFKNCINADDARDLDTYRTPLGHTCAHFRQLLDQGFPDPCDEESKASCPIACRDRILCHQGGSTPGRFTDSWYWCLEGAGGCLQRSGAGQVGLVSYSGVGELAEALKIFDGITTLGDGGAVCMDSMEVSKGNFKFIDPQSGECDIHLAESSVPSRYFDEYDSFGKLLNTQHCRAESLGWPQHCQFDASALTPLDETNWSSFTMGFWLRGRDLNNPESLFFMSSTDAACENSELWSTDGDNHKCGTCILLENGIILSTWTSAGKKTKLWMGAAEIYGGDAQKTQDSWIFHALSWDKETSTITLMVNGRSTSGTAHNAVECTPGLRAIVKQFGPRMAMSQIFFYPYALPIGRVQEWYYSGLHVYGANFLEGASRSDVERLQPTQISRSRYTQGTVAVSTPMVYQTRKSTQACRGKFTAILLNSYAEEERARCQGPYTCNDGGESFGIECRSTEPFAGTHLGRAHVPFNGEDVYAEFLLTITNPLLWRGEQARDPLAFVDFGTERLDIVHVFYTPDYDMASVVMVEFELGMPAISGSYTIRHMTVPHNQVHLILASVFALADLVFTLARVAKQFHSSQPRRKAVSVCEGIFDILLRAFLLVPIVWNAILGVTFEQEFEDAMGGLARINWDDEDFERRAVQYFEAVEKVLMWVNTFEAIRYIEFGAVLCAILRILHYLRMHPRIGLLVRTFELCADDLFHFLVLYTFCLSIFAWFAVCLFGDSASSFSAFWEALDTLYKGFITGEMPQFQTDILAIFVLMFTLIIWGFLLNLFLAIIVEAYLKVKDAIDKFNAENSLVHDMFDMMVYNITSVWYCWPDRFTILSGIKNNTTSLVPRDDFVDNWQNYGFQSEDMADCWYDWQLKHHKMCVYKDKRDKMESIKHDACFHCIYDEDLCDIISSMFANRMHARDVLANLAVAAEGSIMAAKEDPGQSDEENNAGASSGNDDDSSSSDDEGVEGEEDSSYQAESDIAVPAENGATHSAPCAAFCKGSGTTAHHQNDSTPAASPESKNPEEKARSARRKEKKRRNIEKSGASPASEQAEVAALWCTNGSLLHDTTKSDAQKLAEASARCAEIAAKYSALSAKLAAAGAAASCSIAGVNDAAGTSRRHNTALKVRQLLGKAEQMWKHEKTKDSDRPPVGVVPSAVETASDAGAHATI